MIRYNLICEAEHVFDGWFSSSGGYDDQAARGLITCPFCGSTTVGKAIMAPAVATERRGEAAAVAEAVTVARLPVPAAPVALLGEREHLLRKAIAALRAEVERTSTNVGERFAEEARKIHYGESDSASIHGRATASEARELAEEGIAFLPLPVLPDETN